MRLITALGLRKHLEDRVIIGDAEHKIMDALFNKDPYGFGILRQDDAGFYVLKLKKRGVLSRGSKIFEVTDKVYRIKNGNLIATPSKDYLRFYEVDLS